VTLETRTALEALEAEVAAAPAAELPDLIGRLETIKSRAWARLASPVPTQPASSIQAPPEPKPAERLLTAEQAAERLGRSKWWVYRHRAELPHVVLPGGRAGYSAVRLKRWLDDRGR
jgi:hypothetical protein